MSRIGRRLGAGSGDEIPKYIKHPSGSSGNSWLQQGDPIDAGTGHIIDSNISHLDSENVRHLAWDHTVGAVAATDGWDADYSDSPNSAGGSTAIPWRISWDYRTARSYALPAMVADRDLPEGGLALREIHVECYVDLNSASSLYLFAALTPTEAPPTNGALALASAYGTAEAPADIGASTGLRRIEIILRAEVPAGPPPDAWKGSNQTDEGMSAIPVHGGFLWLGWQSSDALNEIQSISAYEVPVPLTCSPDEAGGLLVWHRADSVVTESDDYYANVDRLLDLTGNERHADHSGGSKAFYGQGLGTVQLDSSGSAPMLYFAGVGSQYSVPHESALNPSTWALFFVWKPDPGSASVPWLSLFNKGAYDSGGATGEGFGLSDRTHSGARTNVSGWVDTETTDFVDYTVSGDPEVLWLTYDGNELQLFRNNVSMGVVAKVGYLSSSGDLVIGGMDGDLGNQGFCGAWGESGLFNRKPTRQEQDDLWINYFKPRYRIT